MARLKWKDLGSGLALCAKKPGSGLASCTKYYKVGVRPCFMLEILPTPGSGVFDQLCFTCRGLERMDPHHQ